MRVRYIESRPPAEQGGHIGMHSYTHVCCSDFYTSWQHMRAMNVYFPKRVFFEKVKSSWASAYLKGGK